MVNYIYRMWLCLNYFWNCGSKIPGRWLRKQVCSIDAVPLKRLGISLLQNNRLESDQKNSARRIILADALKKLYTNLLRDFIDVTTWETKSSGRKRVRIPKSARIHKSPLICLTKLNSHSHVTYDALMTLCSFFYKHCTSLLCQCTVVTFSFIVETYLNTRLHFSTVARRLIYKPLQIQAESH